jgi:hypothetical protein
LALADGMAEMSLGETARMNPVEKMMISDPLVRILERYDIDLEGTLGKYADPVILAFGVIAWVSRIRNIPPAAEPAKKEEPTPPPQPLGNVPSENGNRPQGTDFSNLGPPQVIRDSIGTI